jgi:uncharacterized protein (TIGR03437 family)
MQPGTARLAPPRARLGHLLAALALAAGASAQTLPSLSAKPSSLSFSYTIGASTLPSAQTVTVKSSVTSTVLNCTITISPAAPWLIVAPASGSTTLTLRVRVNPTSLAAGTHTTSIVITSAGAGNSPISVPVTLAVKNPPPVMSASAESLTFNYATDDASPPLAQTLTVSTNSEPVSFTATASGGTWLSVTPSSGISLLGSPVNLSVSVDPDSLLPNTYTGKITLTSSTASNKTITVSVSLVIAPGTAVLTSVWPPDVAVGSPDTNITVFGSHLFPDSVVHVGATAITPTWVSTGALLVVVPAELMATQGTLAVTVTNAPNPASNTINWPVTAPGPRIWSVVNAASFVEASPNPVIAPGEIIAIFGSGLGPSEALLAAPSGGAYPTSLGTPPATTTVEVEVSSGSWVAAPLIMAQSGQVNAVVPFNMTPASGMNVRATYNGVTSSSFAVDGVSAEPGIFTFDASGRGQAAVLNYNSVTGALTLNSSSNAAPRGSVIVIYATGGGQTNPLPSPEGQVIPTGGTTPTITGTASVTIGTDTISPDYAGAVPTSIAGLLQINATIPTTATTGKAVPLLVTIDGRTSSTGVTIAVK